MPVVQMGNGYYFLYLIVGVLATIGIIKLLKKKSRGYRHWFLFGVLMASFFVHFIKVIFYPYTTLDYPFRRATFENICAVNTVLFPLVYLTKSKVLKDYMIMSGIFSGLVAFIIPVNAFSEYFDGILLGYQSAFSIEIIRFYFNHLILFLVPFVLMYYKMHTISYKRAYKTILVFFGVLVLIFINELIITALGWVPRAMLFDAEGRNPSLIFGIKGEVAGIANILAIYVPGFMKVHPLTGEVFWWPVIWMIVPFVVYTSLISLGFCLLYDRLETMAFLKKLFRRKDKTIHQS